MGKSVTGLPKVVREKLESGLEFRIDQMIAAHTKWELDSKYSMTMDYIAGFFAALESLGVPCEQQGSYENCISQMYQLWRIVISK